MAENSGNRSDYQESKNTYYYANGQRIRLVREPRVFAVRYRAGRDSRDPDLSRRAFNLLHEESEHTGFISNYGLQIYNINPAAISRRTEPEKQQQDLVAEVKNLEKEAPVEYAAVAYRRNAERAANRIDDLMFVNREFVVQFKSNVSLDEIEKFNYRYGVLILKAQAYVENGFVLQAPEAEGEHGPIVLSNIYYESGLVEFAHPNFIRRRHLRQTGTMLLEPGMEASTDRERADRSMYLSRQWHLETARVVDVWDITRGNSQIKIAILDDGVDTGHPEFSGKISAEYDFASGTADGGPNSSGDRHGTACAGVAVAKGVRAFGSAPDCSLIAVRYPDFLGVVEEAEMFRWTADQGADVISCSWGPADGTGAMDPLPDNVRAAIRYCVNQGRNGLGIPIFWAAGNGNESVSNDGYASNPDIMAVAASSSNERRSWYSDYGPEIFICAPSSGDSSVGERRIFTVDRRGSSGYNPDPDTGAHHPSGDLDYTDDFGGTSSATPLVAGIAGLLLSVNSNLRVQDVRRILQETTDRIDSAGGNYESNGHSRFYGYGRVNALQAVERARNFGGGGGTSTGQLSINAPETINRNDSPPTFQIGTGGRRYYAVEVATRPDLFNNSVHGIDRNNSNFFGSWHDGMEENTPFHLPRDVWDRLKHADHLYYRLHVADDSSWSNHAVTTNDYEAASAPLIRIQSSSGPATPVGTGPSITAPATINRNDLSPNFQVSKGQRRLYAVEVAIRAELFDSTNYGNERNANNFYGSWQDGLEENTPYRLPENVWNRLRQANNLYYRLHVADDNAWSNHNVTISDNEAGTAPHIQITGGPGVTDGGSGGTSRTVVFPSGATFQEVSSPMDGVDYRDHVGNGIVPLIEVSGRMEEFLSPHFKVKEMVSDNSRYARISVELIEGLQNIRDRIGSSLIVKSAYRHPTYNDSVGGVNNSQHIAGRAVDIRTNSMRPLELARVALEELGSDIGIGLGQYNIHVDLRGHQAIWVYEGAELSESAFERWVKDVVQQSGRKGTTRMDITERLLPTIMGPERYSIHEPSPVFFVNPGHDTYYAVEIATHPDLFKDQCSGERTSNNFFASWFDDLLFKACESTTYTLPEEAWKRLRSGYRLYYRILTSAVQTKWENVHYSITGEKVVNAPRIILVDGREIRDIANVIPRLDLNASRRAEEALWRG